MSSMITGVRYKIKEFSERPRHWNSKGHMDRWMGTVVCVIGVSDGRIKIEEDNRRWNWKESDFMEYSEGLSEFGIEELFRL